MKHTDLKVGMKVIVPEEHIRGKCYPSEIQEVVSIDERPAQVLADEEFVLVLTKDKDGMHDIFPSNRLEPATEEQGTET